MLISNGNCIFKGNCQIIPVWIKRDQDWDLSEGSSWRALAGWGWNSASALLFFFFSLAHIEIFREDFWKTPTKWRIHYLMETIFMLRQKSMTYMVAVKSRFLKHHVWEGFLSLAFLFYPCTHWERSVFYLSEQDLGIMGTTGQWGVHTGKPPTDSCSAPWSCTLLWKSWHSFSFHRREVQDRGENGKINFTQNNCKGRLASHCPCVFLPSPMSSCLLLGRKNIILNV